MTTTTTPTTSALIDAIRAFIAEQAQMVRAGLLAASEGNDSTARWCADAVSAAVDAVRDAVGPGVDRFGWGDAFYSGLSEPIPGFDELTEIIDRDHIDDEIDVPATAAAGLAAVATRLAALGVAADEVIDVARFESYLSGDR